jgi:hypothetical protein
MGGKNEWANWSNQNLWRLLAVKYVILDQPVDAPMLVPVGDSLRSHAGRPAFVYRVADVAPYASLVGQALRLRERGETAEQQIVATVLDQGFDPRRLLLLPADSPVGRDTLSADQVRPAIDIPVTVREERPGRLQFDFPSPTSDSAYLVVAENWYPKWRATVDGRPAPVVRAQGSLMAVPVPAGARSVSLEFVADDVALGRRITIISLLAVAILAIVSAIITRRRRLPATAVPLPSPAGASTSGQAKRQATGSLSPSVRP